MSHHHVRAPAVAGAFYPADANALRAELDACLQARPRTAPQADPLPNTAPSTPLKALIVPHAGYRYSGATAGRAYAALAAQHASVRRVVLLGPCHRVAVRGLAAPTVDAFATPLGEVALDRAGIDALADLPQVVARDNAHALEHSLEVQLPFLQRTLDDFSLIPLAVGNASADEVAEVIERLWGGAETLIVVSSDLSHFHDDATARRIDDDTVRRILALEGLSNFDQACGALPINGLLAVARRRRLTIERLAQSNSGDAGGDRTRVVGYAAFGLHAGDADADHALGAALLARARNSIADRLGLPGVPAPDHPALERPGACFVTLNLDGQLRGCIGSLTAHRTLDHDVRANAEAAAFRDPRFAPLSAAEFPRLMLEVSLLDSPRPLPAQSEEAAIAALRPGRDGVILSAPGHRATFLPQVWEQLPEPCQFLARLKEKAGLPAHAWPAGMALERYEVKKWTSTTI